jgi:hypothetical protein
VFRTGPRRPIRARPDARAAAAGPAADKRAIAAPRRHGGARGGCSCGRAESGVGTGAHGADTRPVSRLHSACAVAARPGDRAAKPGTRRRPLRTSRGD